MQPISCAPLLADITETACNASAQPTRHPRDAQSTHSLPYGVPAAHARPQSFASSSVAVAAALQYRQMKQGHAFAASSSKVDSAKTDASLTAPAACSSVGSSSGSTSSVSSLYGRLRSTTPGLATAGASAAAAASAAYRPRCEILSQPPLSICSPQGAACISSGSRNSHTTATTSSSPNRALVPAVTSMSRASSIPHPTRTGPLGLVVSHAYNNSSSSSCPTTNADPADTDMLSLLLAATHMSGAVAAEPAGAWHSNLSSMTASVGQPVMLQQQLPQLQNQSGAHMRVPAKVPASMNGIQRGVMHMSEQQQQQMMEMQSQQVLLQQQALAGTALGTGGPGANSSTTFNYLSVPAATTQFPADQVAMPAYLATEATGFAGSAGSSGDCSNDMLMLLQQQQLVQQQLLGTAPSGAYTAAATSPGSQQLTDVMLLDSCGFNAGGLTALQGLPMGPTDCLLSGSPGSVNDSDAAGANGSQKGDKHGAHAPHNALYKTELCRTWLDAGTCRYGIRCQFAHGHPELRPVVRPPKYKTQPCRTFTITGSCPYGARCNFLHDESNVLSGLAEAVRCSVQGVGGGLRAGGAAVSALFGMSAGAVMPTSGNNSWAGESGLAGVLSTGMGGAGRAEGGSAVAAALAAAGFGGAAAGAGLGRTLSTISHASSSNVGANATAASSSCGGSSGVWPAGIDAAQLGSGIPISDARNSCISAPAMMRHGMTVAGGAGGVASAAGACSGSLQALLMQLPLVRGDACARAFSAGI